ncbi:PleD family two-component system response regulator, partial [Mesorhizobium sp. M8A.F.Ca.ET.198.01.1.1]
IDERRSSVERIQKMLRNSAELDVAADPNAGFFQAAETPYECVLISTAFAGFDALRLCSQLRSLDRTRFLPIMLLADEGEEGRILRGLELGIN